MTREEVDEIFNSDLGEQLDVIFVTSDNKPFIREKEAQLHTNTLLNANPEEEVDTSIVKWHRE